MKSLIVIWVVVLSSLSVKSQTQENSLLYRITGKGIKQPSYVYGTMHVSNKVAFHLSDSFYNALKSVDIIGLETNPADWFDKMLVSRYSSITNLFEDRETKQTSINEENFDFKLTNYFIGKAFNKTPQVINWFLYRQRDNSADFEEDTYLDLYIYQIASKLGKKVLSVEDFEESERLVTVAKKALRDKRTKYIRNIKALKGDETSESVYRKGNLAMLDSLNRLSGYPEEWYENMLYKRNENMAIYIDSILNKQSIFVGVGASHLPGKRGVLNMLREMGYTVVPIVQGSKNSAQKEAVNALVAPVRYNAFTTDDSLFTVKIPSKCYIYPKENFVQKYLAQDMANGSYYLITRIKTYATLFNQSEDYSLNRVDSLLYENIQGKIEVKKEIVINGYKGFDILNKTGRGNYQRHYIIILPNEIILFKMHGINEYVKLNGDIFFKSIVFHEQQSHGYDIDIKHHGFTAHFPMKPMIQVERSLLPTITPATKEWIGYDKKQDVSYLLLQFIVNNVSDIEEDSFELELLIHSFSQQLGATVLAVNYTFSEYNSKVSGLLKLQNNDSAKVCIVMEINKVFVLYASKILEHETESFFQSFTLSSVNYEKPLINYVDTLNKFHVSTYIEPNNFDKYISEEIEDYSYKSKILTFADGKSGEEVKVNIYRYNKYDNEPDSLTYWKDLFNTRTKSNDYKLKILSSSSTKDLQMMDILIGDTASTKGIRVKTFLMNNVVFKLSASSLSNGELSRFAEPIFNTFSPIDTIGIKEIYFNRTEYFLRDILSPDSATRAQAEKSIGVIHIDKNNSKKIVQTIDKLTTSESYEKIKVQLIEELAYAKDYDVIPWLENTYLASKDSIKIQLAVLNVLSKMPNKKAYNTWKKLIQNQFPEVTDKYEANKMISGFARSDTSEFVKIIFPQLLKLLHTDEFKSKAYEILAELKREEVISNKSYKHMIETMLADARRELKLYKNNSGYYNYTSSLKSINELLLPYYHIPEVKQHFDKVLKLKNTDMKMGSLALLLENNISVEDSILYNFAANKHTRQLLYEKLQGIEKENLFPTVFSNDASRLEGVIYSVIKFNREDADTIVLLGFDTINSKGKQNKVYSFKFKRDDDLIWQYGIAGILLDDYCYVRCVPTFTGVSKKYNFDTIGAKAFISNEVRTIRSRNKSNSYPNSSYEYYDIED